MPSSTGVEVIVARAALPRVTSTSTARWFCRAKGLGGRGAQRAWKVIQGCQLIRVPLKFYGVVTHTVLRAKKAAFFGYFLCSGKESNPRPGEGHTNRPTRIQAQRDKSKPSLIKLHQRLSPRARSANSR